MVPILLPVAPEPTPGSGDCEEHVAGWGQPVLAATSFAYILAAIAVLWWARRHHARPAPAWSFAAGLALAGLGSIDYHGPALGPEPLLHDGGLAIALVVAFGIDLIALGVAARTAIWTLTVVTVALLGVIAIYPTWSPALAGVAGAGLVVTEVLVYRRHLRRMSRSVVVGVVALGIGGVIFALSRTGGVLCDPGSWWQGHGLWHILTAVALACWGVASLPVAPAPVPARP